MKHRKLRRLGIAALVLVLLFNTIGAQASTGAPDVTVSSYEELIQAIEQASNLDIILIAGVISIPEGASLGSATKTVTLKSSGGYLEVVEDPEKEEITTLTSLVFDGAGLNLLAPYLRIEGNVEAIGCTFKNCGACGAVNMSYSNSSFSECTFKDNRGAYGAHICIGHNGSASFANCLFTGGVSSNRGGAVYLDASTSTAIITDSTITGNSGAYGGGIANWGNVTVSNSLLYGNTASTGGADIFSVGSYALDSLEDMKTIYHEAGLEPVSWESDYTDENYGATCLKLIYEEYIAPIEPSEPAPIEPEETEPTTPPEETEEPTTPSEEDTEPTEPDETEGSQEPDDEGEPSTPATPNDTDQTGGENTDNSSTDNSNNSITDNSTTDNSQTIIDSSQNNSTSSSTVDNSSHESNDNSSYSEDNSYRDSSSIVNYYYQQENTKQEPTASQNGSQPINITVPVEVSTQQGENATTGSTAAPEGDAVTAPIQQNIRIEAEGVDLVYEYTAEGVNISISSPEAPESPTEAMVVNTSSPLTETPQAANKSPNWVEYVSMTLLAVLVVLEIKDKKKPHKEG